MKFLPIAGALGAEVIDIDLKKQLDTATKDTLKSGLLKYQVIYFRDQNITSKQQLDLAKVFGEAVIHPAYPQDKEVPEVNILINDKDKPSKIELWHTDMTFMNCPPLGSILKAEKIPNFGGDTLFASSSAISFST